MDVVSVEAKTIKGLKIRTRNQDEMNRDTAQIPAFVQKVDQLVTIDYPAGARAYSVYFNYESDVNGAYDLLMGSDNVAASEVALESITIQAGHYLKFSGQGEFPQAIIDTWQRVWAYFTSDACQHTRRYTTDFEYYEGPDAVSIYIAIDN